jgi:hypothetical protein
MTAGRPPTFLASSTGLLLKTLGLKVTSIKIDPYMNIDAGTMAPTEHGQSRFFEFIQPPGNRAVPSELAR